VRGVLQESPPVDSLMSRPSGNASGRSSSGGDGSDISKEKASSFGRGPDVALSLPESSLSSLLLELPLLLSRRGLSGDDEG